MVEFKSLREQVLIKDYKKKTRELAEKIVEEGEIDMSTLKGIEALSDRRRRIVMEGRWYERAWNKVQIPVKVVGDVTKELEKRGVTLPYMKQFSLLTTLIKPKKSMEKKQSKPWKWIRERLKEKSTYAGIATVLAIFGFTDVGTETIEAIALAVAGVIGAYLAIMRERGSEKV